MLAAEGGVKWRGMAVNGQYFFRWLNNFRADGPIPVPSTFDHGLEMVVSQFVVPKKWEVYGRTSLVFGRFRNSYGVRPGRQVVSHQEPWRLCPLLIRVRLFFR